MFSSDWYFRFLVPASFKCQRSLPREVKGKGKGKGNVKNDFELQMRILQAPGHHFVTYGFHCSCVSVQDADVICTTTISSGCQLASLIG